MQAAVARHRNGIDGRGGIRRETRAVLPQRLMPLQVGIGAIWCRTVLYSVALSTHVGSHRQVSLMAPCFIVAAGLDPDAIPVARLAEPGFGGSHSVGGWPWPWRQAGWCRHTCGRATAQQISTSACASLSGVSRRLHCARHSTTRAYTQTIGAPGHRPAANLV